MDSYNITYHTSKPRILNIISKHGPRPDAGFRQFPYII